MSDGAPLAAATSAPPPRPWRRRLRRCYDAVDIALFAVGLFALLATASRYAQEFPFADEWRYCDFFQGQSFWQFVRTPHNEHNIWVSKALTLPLVLLTGWNTRILVLLGLGVYAAAASLFFLLIRRQTSSPFLRCGAALLLVLPGSYDNLVWAWQTTFHLCFFFGVCALWALERATAVGAPPAAGESRRAVLFAASAALAVLALFSVGGGVAYALGLAAALALGAFQGVARPGREFWTALGSAAALLASVAYYLHISPHPSHHPPLLLPWQDPALFARLVVTGVGLGLTFPNHSEVAFAAGVAALIVIAFGAAAAGRRAGRALTVVAAVVTALIAPAMVAVARGRFGADAIVTSRYLEINIVVALPFFWALGRLYELRSRVLKVAVVAVALAVPLHAAAVITPALAQMTFLHEDAQKAQQCWRQHGAAKECITGDVYPFAEYVTGCLETIHARWGNWGHIGEY